MSKTPSLTKDVTRLGIHLFELLYASMLLEKELGRQPGIRYIAKYLGVPQPTITKRARDASRKYGLTEPFPPNRGHNKQCFTLTEHGARVMLNILSGNGEVLITRIHNISLRSDIKPDGVKYRHLLFRDYKKLKPPEVFQGAYIVSYARRSGKDQTAVAQRSKADTPAPKAATRRRRAK